MYMVQFVHNVNFAYIAHIVDIIHIVDNVHIVHVVYTTNIAYTLYVVSALHTLCTTYLHKHGLVTRIHIRVDMFPDVGHNSKCINTYPSNLVARPIEPQL